MSAQTTLTLDAILRTSCKSVTPGSDQHQTDYWNIDDILAEDDIVRATFKTDARNLGYLTGIDQQNSHVALDADQKKFGA